MRSGAERFWNHVILERSGSGPSSLAPKLRLARPALTELSDGENTWADSTILVSMVWVTHEKSESKEERGEEEYSKEEWVCAREDEGGGKRKQWCCGEHGTGSQAQL